MEEKNIIQHNLEKEKKLIDLLGYNLIGPDNNNRWIILDENNNEVGFIQYKKLHNGNKKEGVAKIFGYHTIIDSKDIACEFTREANDKNGSIMTDIDYNYKIDIKKDNEKTDHIELSMGKFPCITMWSKEYGFINFSVDGLQLYLNYKSKTDNFNIEEILIYSNIGDKDYKNDEYTYQLRYCKKDLELSDFNAKGRTSREIRGVSVDDRFMVIETTWINDKFRNQKRNIVDGNVKEMAIKHQMGIDCFNHFRYLINKILPFKKDLIETMLTDDIIARNGLDIFISPLEKEISKEDENSQSKLARREGAIKLGLKISDYPGEKTRQLQPEFKIQKSPEPGNTIPSHNRFFHHGLANALRQGGPWDDEKMHIEEHSQKTLKK